MRGSVARRACKVLVVSGDRDTIQLVNDDVTLLYPRKGVSDLVNYTPSAVVETYEVRPEQYPDLAALVGETSDNLPGVPGVGPKTAAKWINTYGGLAGILEAADDVPGKAGESLRAHLDQVRLNRQLNHLLTDMEVDMAVADMEYEGGDAAAIHAGVRRAPVPRRCATSCSPFATSGEVDAGSRPWPNSSIITDEPVAGIARTVGALRRPRRGPHRRRRRRVGAWRGDERRSPRMASTSPSLTPTTTPRLRAWLANPDDSQGAARVEGRDGTRSPRAATRSNGVVGDTQIAAFLVNPDQRGFTLENDRAALRGRLARRERRRRPA